MAATGPRPDAAPRVERAVQNAHERLRKVQAPVAQGRGDLGFYMPAPVQEWAASEAGADVILQYELASMDARRGSGDGPQVFSIDSGGEDDGAWCYNRTVTATRARTRHGKAVQTAAAE